MMRFILCLILVQFSFTMPALAVSLAELQHPLARLAVVSFFTAPEAKENERAIFMVDQLEKALTHSSRISVNSLEHYKSLRHAVAENLETYLSQIRDRGLINPFSISTPNSQVFEQIVEFEVAETQRLLVQWETHAIGNKELRPIVESLKSVLSVFQMGVQFRDRLNENTKVLENIPVLNWFRKAGENIVNPLVRGVVYSDTVIQLMRDEVRVSLRRVRQNFKTDPSYLVNEIKQKGLTVFESMALENFKELEFLKPIQSVDKEKTLELVLDFFSTLPKDLKNELVWFWINHLDQWPRPAKNASDSPHRLIWFLKNKHPRTAELIKHFIFWSEDEAIRKRVQDLSELPILTTGISLAKLALDDLNYSSGDSAPRFLGEFSRRRWTRRVDTTFRFYLDAEWTESSSQIQFSLTEFLDKFPQQAEF